MAYLYSWMPAYKQIVAKLPQYRNHQADLVQVLRDIGVNVNNDEDHPGHSVPLTEIDPFTFLFFLGKHRNEWNKVKVLRNLCKHWDIDCKVYDVCGIPTANAQRLWMFSFKYSRKNEIARLWDLFNSLLQNTLTDQDFKEATAFPAVGKTKLSEVFFIINPQEYLCINGKVKPYLNGLNIHTTEFETFSQYKAILQVIRTKVQKPFHEISFLAHLKAEYGDHETSFFRIGTTVGEKGESMLPTMLANCIVSIGWHDLGDLQEMEPCNRLHVKNALQQKGYWSNDNRTASRKAGEIVKFKGEIKPGDVVLAAEGQSIKAIGRVLSNHYFYDESLEFPHGRCVDWEFQNINDLEIIEGVRTTVWRIENEENLAIIRAYIGGIENQDSLTNIPKFDQSQPRNNFTMALNTILFGPPGTGKTYKTIDWALTILDEDIEVTREERKRLFAEYQQDGRIFFTTFHQNMAYEDFIEGIKPVKPNEDDEFLKYDIQDGIFMKACVEATYRCLKTVGVENSQIAIYEDYNEIFDALYERVLNAGKEQMATRQGGFVSVTVTAQGNFAVVHEGGSRPYTVSRERLSVLYDLFPDPDEIVNISHSFRQAIGGCNSTAYWSVLNAIASLRDIEEVIDEKDGQLGSPEDLPYEDKRHIVKRFWEQRDSDIRFEGNPERVVFIIDEINRGNVSQIFGELITLIESDKRIGCSENLYVDLPYSKMSFGVPPNLYIIGTMNTADRSVEALDTALRRRFSFKHMIPDPLKLESTKDGIELPSMLEKINKRLSILKDSDHTIGHAWFMEDHTEKDVKWLKGIFKDKILPLLQEYFYGDYEKIGLVLGEQFFEVMPKVNTNEFASFKMGTGMVNQYKQKRQYKLKSVEDLTETDFKAIYEGEANTLTETDEDE